MTTILVTTSDDEVMPGDGQTSLREAVAEAQNGDTIVFGGLGAVFLTSSLTINKSIAIDGTGGASGEFFVTDISGPIVIQAGADVTMSRLMVSGGTHGANATDGAAGAEGDPSTDGTPGTNGTGGNGGDATSGGDGGNGVAPAKGQAALGGIENDGTLTLDHVELGGVAAVGGDGGGGGEGGAGSTGGNGGGGGSGLNGSHGGNGGKGGFGGNGGNGAPGSNGGDAVAGILNTGTLTIKDSLIHGAIATGGNGGNGGAGADAGFGGNGGGGGFTVKPAGSGHAGTPGNGGNAGDGGNGGNGGNAGDGGNAIAGIDNSGTMTIVGATILYNNNATGGMAGQIGAHGPGHAAGTAGTGGLNTETNAHGTDGQDGQHGVDGSDGNPGIGGSSSSGLTGGFPVSGTLTFNQHFYEFDQTKTFFEQPTVLVGGEGDAVDTTVTLRVEMLGDSSVAGAVDWQVAAGGIPLTDFAGPVSGTLNFTTGALFQYLTLTIKPDAAAPRNESFNVQILNPKTGDVLGSTTTFTQNIVNVHITNANQTIIGTQFSEVIVAGNGKDHVLGEGGGDVIYAGKGNDTIDAGPGNSFLYAGRGKDAFIFDSTLDAATNVETISNFSAHRDKIELRRADFHAVGGHGVLGSSRFEIGPHADNRAERIIYNPHTGDLFYHAPGTPLDHQVEFAVLTTHTSAGLTHPTITHADILVI